MARSKCDDKGISRRDVLKAGGALVTSTALCGLLPKASAAKGSRRPKNFKFKKLFEPGRIGKFTIKNRIIKSSAGPGSMASQNDDGSPNSCCMFQSMNPAPSEVRYLDSVKVSIPLQILLKDL